MAHWKKGEERGGGGWEGRVFCFLALSLLFDLMTLCWTWPPPFPSPLHFLTPLTFSPAQSLNTFILSEICHNMKMAETRETCGQDHHTCSHCWVCFFYTLHTSADGLSIDFDLPFLSSSVSAYVRWGLYDNSYPPICSYLKTLLAWLSKYE